MQREMTKEQFQIFLDKNRDRLQSMAVRPEDLPEDDECILDDIWEDLYKRE